MPANPSPREPLLFFNEADAAIIEAATARIFPSDELGPGAREARVVIYLDRALEFDPGNEALLQEKDLITKYLEGLEAYSSERWDLAIYAWGPVYAIRSSYQGGVLEESLKLACASSESPDEALCPP